jgi:hypothetical protein
MAEEEEALKQKIINKERIILSSDNDFLRTSIFFMLVLSLLLSLLIFYHFDISLITICSSLAIAVTYWMYFKTVKKYVAASIKGEMLLTRNLFHESKVTSLKSIKSISSKTIFGINHTAITYKMDGVKYKIRMIKKIDSQQLKIDQILKTAIQVAC